MIAGGALCTNSKNAMIQQLVELKIKYPCLKVIGSIGGWSISGHLYYLLKNGSRRDMEHFAESSMNLSRALGFDGIDLDFEWNHGDTIVCSGGNHGYHGYPTTPRTNPPLNKGFKTWVVKYGELLEIIRSKLMPHEHLSIAIQMNPSYIDDFKYKDAYKKVIKNVDSINCMTYDYNGSWNPPGQYGHNAPLFSSAANPNNNYTVSGTVSQLADIVGGYSKLAMGLAFYGRQIGGNSMGTWEGLDHLTMII